MENTKEVMMAIMSSDTKEVVKELEILDESSMVLAKTYITALADKIKFEKAKLAVG